MFLTRKHLSRRTVLKGAGATIALPLLDAMIPAGTALAQTAAAPATRLGFIYFPHGALQDEWQPATTGRNPKFPFILEPLEPVRDYVTIVSGLRNKAGEGGVPHGITQETWLNCVHPRQRSEETGIGVTADQLAARHLQKDTTLPSMEICGEPGGMISFRSPTQPLPMEGNPRKVFISMFGQGQTTEERQAILGTTTSLLDYVTEATASLNRKLDAADRAKVDELPRLGPRGRAARREAQGEQRVAREPARRARRRARRLRRAARRPVRAVRAGVGDEPHERRDDEDGRGSEHAGVREPRRPRRVPPDVALGRLPGAHRELAQDPELPHGRCSRSSRSAWPTRRTATARCSTIRSFCSAATWATAMPTTPISCRKR